MSVRLLTLNALVPRAGGVYNVGLGFLFGMSTWVTFFGGIIAFKTLREPYLLQLVVDLPPTLLQLVNSSELCSTKHFPFTSSFRLLSLSAYLRIGRGPIPTSRAIHLIHGWLTLLKPGHLGVY